MTTNTTNSFLTSISKVINYQILKVYHSLDAYDETYYYPLNEGRVMADPIGLLEDWMVSAIDNDESVFDYRSSQTFKKFDDKVAKIVLVASSRPGQDFRESGALKRPAEDHPAGWWAISAVLGSQDLMRGISKQAYTNKYES